METIYLGAGCFWCTEAVFTSLKGVVSVMPGYMGGHTDHPTYEAVCTGNTGHAEVAKIEYDPNILSTEKLLQVFFDSHDPTTIDRQGADVGSQYRSVIFYTEHAQREVAEQVMKERATVFPEGKSIVTELLLAPEFYPAENYHHDYYERNKDKMYCQLVIAPKIEKLEQEHNDLLKH
jgi:peptide-methionine (S)-S-oxide reductase